MICFERTNQNLIIVQDDNGESFGLQKINRKSKKTFETAKFKIAHNDLYNKFTTELEYSEYKAIGEVTMPNNDLINIANVLSEKLNSNAPTSLADMVVDNGQKKQLNYEIMFQLLMGECEKHILENVGNPID